MSGIVGSKARADLLAHILRHVLAARTIDVRAADIVDREGNDPVWSVWVSGRRGTADAWVNTSVRGTLKEIPSLVFDYLNKERS